MQRLIWALYVEHEWVPGADQLVATPAKGLSAQEYGRYNSARLAAKRMMDRLFPADEPAEVSGG